MPGPHGLPRAEHCRKIAPRDPAPIPVNDPFQHRPRVRELPTRATRRPRQHPIDQRPLSIRKQPKPRHRSSVSTDPLNLCQTRPDESEVAALLKGFNEALARDGYELYASDWISGHAVYGWRRLDAFHGSAPELRLSERPLTDPAVLQEHLTRIRAGLVADPAAAISSCKNLLESLFKIILDRSGVSYGGNDDVPRLYRKVAELLALNAEAVPESARASQTSQQILRTLVTTVSSLAELRNELGIGHGQSSRSAALARHARLALNATVTIAEFVLDTWQARIESGALELPS